MEETYKATYKHHFHWLMWLFLLVLTLTESVNWLTTWLTASITYIVFDTNNIGFIYLVVINQIKKEKQWIPTFDKLNLVNFNQFVQIIILFGDKMI